jgi:4-hydroxybenzoate polyprenyltransferase
LATTVRNILELIRFSHTLFALPFALLAAVMAWAANANETPAIGWRSLDLLGIILCMVTARSAAMAFNRLADWRIDAQNARTKGRHIPAGILSVRSVAVFAVACAAAFVASTLLFLPNWLPVVLSVPVLAFLLGYSYAKRFTSLAHFWLGAALMLAPLCAWIALRGQLVIADPADLLPPLVLAAAVMLWVAGFDVIYACQDYEFDLRAGLRSMPVKLGVRGALRLAALCHFAMVAVLATLPSAFPLLGGIYYLGIAAVGLLLLYEHSLVKPNDLARINQAFFHVNAVVSIGLLAVASLDLLLGSKLLG